MKDQIRWGFLGCGAVTEKTSGPAFGRVPQSSIYAICRRNLSNAHGSAQRLGAERWYNSADSLLSDANVDAVYVATPPGLHYEHAMACCRAGKPVYIEKPFARSFKEAEAIVRAFELQRVPLFVAHYRRSLPRFLLLKSIIESGELGAIRDVTIRLERRFEDDRLHPWLFVPSLSGGGKFVDIAPHTIDLLIFLFGPFDRVASVVTSTDSGMGLEDLVSFCFKTTRGVVGTANFNLVGQEKGDRLCIYGTRGSITGSVHGEKPYEISGLNARTIQALNPRYIEEPMIEQVVRSLMGLDASPCFGHDALETYLVIDDILAGFYGGRDDDFWNRPIGRHVEIAELESQLRETD